MLEASRRRGPIAPALLLLFLAACGGEPGSAPQAPQAPAAGERFRFTDVAAKAGLTTLTWCGRPEKPHLCESGGSGVALVDVDQDGDLDAFLVNSWKLAGAEIVERGKDRLYVNRGDGTFEDRTEAAGVGDEGWGNGVAVGDPDGDGDPDLYVSNFGPDSLYLNRGDGTFERRPGPPGTDGWSTGAAFFDADKDGDEDLYVAAYIEITEKDVLQAQPTLDWKGTKVMFGPFGLTGAADHYFENLGGGRFEDATERSGLADVGLFFGFGVAAFDVDQDRDLDLFVANDSNPNYLFINDGKGHFEETGLWSGAALSASGASQAGMGVGVGDFNGDQRSDVLVTNFADDNCALYKNIGRGLFTDVSVAAGLIEPTMHPLSWGTVLADFDLDGDDDLFIANGHIYPQADTTPGSGTTFKMRNLLLENVGGKFRDATAEAGPGLAVIESSRGTAAGDVDGDGDLDLLVSNVDAPPTLLRNDAKPGGSWLLVDAPEALRLEVEAGGKRWARDRVAGGSYLSASDPRFHLGLGQVERIDSVTLIWRDGSSKVLKDVPTRQVLRVKRGD